MAPNAAFQIIGNGELKDVDLYCPTTFQCSAINLYRQQLFSLFELKCHLNSWNVDKLIDISIAYYAYLVQSV